MPLQGHARLYFSGGTETGMKKISYKTWGTCSRAIDVTVDDDGVITECRYTGGCQGNTRGISMLVVGMKASDVIARLKGVQCGSKGTSCPDQLARALQESLDKEQSFDDSAEGGSAGK